MSEEKVYKCDYKGCSYEHVRAQVVGRHRKMEHNIPGSSPTVVSEQKRKLAITTVKKTKLTKKEAHAHAHPQENSLQEITAYTLGRIDQLILSIALEHDVLPKQLARGCIEYFRLQALR
jgi:hypothetical protein